MRRIADDRVSFRSRIVNIIKDIADKSSATENYPNLLIKQLNRNFHFFGFVSYPFL